MKNDDENQQGGGFLDKNTITAVVLSFLVFFGWQMYMGKKYPPKTAPTPTITKEAITTEERQDTARVVETPPSAATTKIIPHELQFASKGVAIDFMNKGFGIKKISLNEFSTRDNKPIEYDFTDSQYALMATEISGQNEFQIRQVSSSEFEGVLSRSDMSIVKSVQIDVDKYVLKTKIKIQFTEAQKLNLVNTLFAKIEKVDKTFFLPAYEHQEIFVLNSEKTSREILTLDTPAEEAKFDGVNLTAINGQYFALAAINNSNILPSVTTSSDGQLAKIAIQYQTTEAKNEFEVDYDLYFGPKSAESLISVNASLEELIDYGMFSIIGRPLLAVMKVIFSFFSNWGVAIILLTLLVKIVLLPLHLYSTKSMKKMQKIQPRLKELKEKFKNDPQRMNQETLLLMKAEKANPLSGCLPMLMQIPIFIALYSMLGKSFELYKQPFFLWVNDLSAKDPYYVLPVLAAGVFFIQQKITPTVGMDPAQAKIMMFMPLMMLLFMITVPSGLALYMFVNAVFSVVQQYVVMNEKTT